MKHAPIAAVIILVVVFTGCVEPGRETGKDGKSVRRVEREKLLGELIDKQNQLGYDEGAKRIFQYQERIVRTFLEAEDHFDAKDYATALIRFEEVIEMINAIPSKGPVAALEVDAKSYIEKANRNIKRR